MRQIATLLLSFLLLLDVCPRNQSVVHIKNYCTKGSDISDVLQELVNKYHTIVIDKGTWVVSKPIYLHSYVVIKGVSVKKSILSVDPNAIVSSGRKFCMFTTVKPVSLYGEQFRSLPAQQYETKTFTDIHISNLSIRVNRFPVFFSEKRINPRTADLNVVRFENCRNCSLSNCIITDYCTPESFNINSVVKLVESDSCRVENCRTENCTFVQMLGGKGHVICSNTGNNSVGTWIESSGGREHVIANNTITNVICNVSTIGINSCKCEVYGNRIENDNGREISCLTLGHNQDELLLDNGKASGLCNKADSCHVYDNIFNTTVNVAILVQNGNTILIENNRLKSIPNRDDSAPSCLYIHGQDNNLFGIKVINNTFEVFGEKGSVICGSNLNYSLIEGNSVNTTCRYVFRLTKHTSVSTIVNNVIHSCNGEIVSADDTDTLRVRNNSINGGYLNLHCNNLFFENNTWENIESSSIFERGKSFPDYSHFVFRNNEFKMKGEQHIRLFRSFPQRIQEMNGKVSGNKINGVETDTLY